MAPPPWTFIVDCWKPWVNKSCFGRRTKEWIKDRVEIKEQPQAAQWRTRIQWRRPDPAGPWDHNSTGNLQRAWHGHWFPFPQGMEYEYSSQSYLEPSDNWTTLRKRKSLHNIFMRYFYKITYNRNMGETMWIVWKHKIRKRQRQNQNSDIKVPSPVFSYYTYVFHWNKKGFGVFKRQQLVILCD